MGLRHWLVSLFLAVLIHALFFAFLAANHFSLQGDNTNSNIVRLSFGALRPDNTAAVELTEVEQVQVEEVEVNSSEMIEVVEVNPMIFTEELVAVDFFDAEVTTVEVTDITPTQESSVSRSDSNAEQSSKVEQTANIEEKYHARLQAWLEKHKRYPVRARRQNIEGIVQLHFIIDMTGKVLEYNIEQSSGHEILDREVEAMIKRADPVPEIPEALKLQRLELVIPIAFKLR